MNYRLVRSFGIALSMCGRVMDGLPSHQSIDHQSSMESMLESALLNYCESFITNGAFFVVNLKITNGQISDVVKVNDQRRAERKKREKIVNFSSGQPEWLSHFSSSFRWHM